MKCTWLRRRRQLAVIMQFDIMIMIKIGLWCDCHSCRPCSDFMCVCVVAVSQFDIKQAKLQCMSFREC